MKKGPIQISFKTFLKIKIMLKNDFKIWVKGNTKNTERKVGIA